MPLTRENMETDPTGTVGNPVALWNDIYGMNLFQLRAYVRTAFSKEYPRGEHPRSLDFLPRPFWDNVTYDSGGLYPWEVFVGRYVTRPNSSDGTFTYPGDGTKVRINPRYRDRFGMVLKEILQECINNKREPTRKLKRLAINAVRAVRDIGFSDGPNNPEQQLVEAIKNRSRGGKGMPATELPDAMSELKYPDVDSNELFRLARSLVQDPRYDGLDLTRAINATRS